MTVPPIRFALALLLAAPLAAQVAPRATAVLAQPDENAALLKLVKSGEALPAAADAPAAPVGWSAVALPGPHEVYVENKYINKELEIRPGSPLHLAPKSDAPVLILSTADDDIEITGLRGRWTQLRLNKSVVGYVQGAAGTPAIARTAPVVTTTPVKDQPTTSTGAPIPPTPQAGRAVNRTESERTSLAALPRLFEGKLTSTRSPLRPRRPYDFALETEDGVRFAYLDLTKLLLTEQIENYLDRVVVVYGVARPVPETKDIVIVVESLQSR